MVQKINTGNCGNLGQYMQDLAIWVQDKFKINLGSRDKYWKGSKDKYWKLWKSRSMYAAFCNLGSREREALQIITPTACRAAEVMPHCPCILLKKVLSPTVQCIWDNKYTWIPLKLTLRNDRTHIVHRDLPYVWTQTICNNLFEEKTARKISWLNLARQSYYAG